MNLKKKIDFSQKLPNDLKMTLMNSFQYKEFISVTWSLKNKEIKKF